MHFFFDFSFIRSDSFVIILDLMWGDLFVSVSEMMLVIFFDVLSHLLFHLHLLSQLTVIVVVVAVVGSVIVLLALTSLRPHSHVYLGAADIP